MCNVCGCEKTRPVIPARDGFYVLSEYPVSYHDISGPYRIQKEIILAWRVGPSGDTVPVTLCEHLSSIRAILQPDGSV